jgi:3-hydroxybutyryl-CoA dehydrogenase
VEKERISREEMDETLARIESGTEYAADADLAIEAVVEVAEVKAEVFRALNERLGEDAILATNTSSISITELAATTRRPERFIGMHFFNPVPLMKLVEIVRGLETAEETHSAVHELAERLGKEPVEVRDFPGFVSNRVLMPMINEAVYCVMEGVAGPEEVDTVMKLGMNHPMGPLALADLIGLDTCLHIMEVLHEGFGDTKYRPCPLLRRYVAAGRLGHKSGKGFYEYE